jgi:RNA polymerase sigma factor (sigma-70 family)
LDAQRVYMGDVARLEEGLPVEVTVREGPAGDAFTAWVTPHLPDLWRFAVSLTGFDAADDLLQDCLARAWAKRDQFDEARGSAKTWLFAIMADRARHGWSRGRTVPRIDVRLPADRMLGDHESARVDLRRAVDALPKRQRIAVTLHYYLDFPIAEVAELMSCSVGTVKSNLHDARHNLAERLGGSYA